MLLSPQEEEKDAIFASGDSGLCDRLGHGAGFEQRGERGCRHDRAHPRTAPEVGDLIGANRFYDAGYTGSGTISYNIEAGHIWSGHESLTHVSVFTNGTGALGEFDRHATWVGMLLGGRGAAHQRGIAYGTDLRSGAIATAWFPNPTPPRRFSTAFDLTNASTLSTYAAAFGTADVINSSWGSSGTTSAAAGHDAAAIGIDGMAFANPASTFVAASGNIGPDAGTVGSPGSGYNGITVGALLNDGDNHYNTIASFSSRGPQPFYYPPGSGYIANARAAVDIVAPGSALVSAYYGGETGGNRSSLGGAPSGLTDEDDLYSLGLQGTSFAAPIVAGGVALMKDAAKANALPATALDTRVVKASLLNSADKIDGWDNAQNTRTPTVGQVVTTSQSLDFASGAGAMNLDKAFDQFLTGQTDLAGTDGGTSSFAQGWDYGLVDILGNTDVTFDTLFAGGTTFTATLDWFADRTYTNVNSFSEDGFADLDLQIWDATFTTLLAESISPFNNVEHLSFTLPQDTAIGLRVAYEGNIYGTMSSEAYALAWSGTFVPEPSGLALLTIASLALLRRRRSGLNSPM